MEVYDSKSTQSLAADLKTLVSNWRLILSLAKIELNNRYKKTALGALWSIINPLLTSIIVYFIFGGIFNGFLPGDRGYFFWVFSGFVLQAYLLQGILVVVSQIIANLALITNYRVNPVLVSFSISLSASLNFLIGCVALIPAALISGHQISLRVVFIPLLAFFVTLLLSGSSMLLIKSFRKYDDSAYIVGLLIMVIAYLSPFLYPFDILKPPLSDLVSANPLTSFILTFRWLVLENQDFDVRRLLVVLLSSIGVFLIGVRYLRSRWNETLML